TGGRCTPAPKLQPVKGCWPTPSPQVWPGCWPGVRPSSPAPSSGVDFGRELHAWHHRLAAAARATTTIHRKPLRCPACHMFRLEHRDGDDVVRCANPGCGFELGLGEYEALVEQAVNQAS